MDFPSILIVIIFAWNNELLETIKITNNTISKIYSLTYIISMTNYGPKVKFYACYFGPKMF